MFQGLRSGTSSYFQKACLLRKVPFPIKFNFEDGIYGWYIEEDGVIVHFGGVCWLKKQIYISWHAKT